MSRIRIIAGLVLCVGLAPGARPKAFAQPAPESPLAGLPPEMKAYTETIPGTDVSFDMVPVPGGTFLMGSPAGESDRGEDEGPQRQVAVGPFWMGKFEVSWDEYDEFAFALDLRRKTRDKIDLTKQPESEKKSDAVTRPTPPFADETFGMGREGQPVICITHHAAMEYTRWLSAKTSKLYRLPTEAEWEYACRAGSKTAYCWGDDPAQLGEYGWYVENAEKPQPVGKKKPNAWGLFDLHGNAAEWCLDHYLADAYARTPPGQIVFRPVVPPDSKEYPYVARGGSWDDDPDKLRSAARRASNPEWSVQDPQRPQSIWWHTDATFVGFRIIRPYQEQPNLKGLKSLVVKGKGTR